jgi:hypothetical protein
MRKPDRPRFDNKPALAWPSPKSAETSEIPPGPQQLAAVRQFVAQVGGIENARRVLELLAILSAAGQSTGSH